MKRAPSALLAIGGFGVAVAMLSVATTAAIVLAAPPPPPMRTTAVEAIMALKHPVPGFARRIATAPPDGARITVIEGLIAGRLGRQAGDVRATRLESGAPVAVSIRTVPGATGRRIDRAQLGDSIVLRPYDGKPVRVLPPGTMGNALGSVLIDLPFPAYAVSLRQPDGRWLVAEPVRPFLGGWQRSILIALGISLLLLAPLTWFFARRMTRPFRALADALERGATPIPHQGPRELREAAAAIAAMRNRLAMEAAERARMLTAIAHDLRTPLTGLRLRIETTPEPQRARMVADIERMQAMIGEVLSFARDAAAQRVQVAVRPLIATIIEELGERGRAVKLLPGDDATIAVPAPAFRRAIENLLRNAIDYAGGGTISIERVDDSAVVSVCDTGPGIPAADRERLLRPFERGEASRNRDTGGAGLGLSIVRDFAAQNAGSFALAESPGGGTIARLRLPCAPRAGEAAH
jgi:signal transduction histidine kinase